MRAVKSVVPRSPLGDSPLFDSARTNADPRSRMRRNHLIRVLSEISTAEGEATRASIARITGLTSATISSLVSELMDLDFIVEGPTLESTGGKPAISLRVRADAWLVLVLIVRAHHIESIALDLTGHRVYEQILSHPEGVIPSDVQEAARELGERYADRLLTLVIQSPGVTDGQRVIESALLQWHSVDLADLVRDASGLTPLIVNDAVGEALTEAAHDKLPVNRLVVRLGEGIGAAVTIDGAALLGATHQAGEIGHVPVSTDAPRRRCLCGRWNCLEAVASLRAALGPRYSDELDAASAMQLARENCDPESVRTSAAALAGVIRVSSALVDPTEIVLAGRAWILGDTFLDAIRESFAARPALGAATPPIRFARGGDPGVGPGRLALTQLFGVPIIPMAPPSDC